MKQKAFTLAEVLITLMIIGIVAALTIPSVISNYQQQEFKTGLKKAVSVLNEAIQTNIAQEGETPYDRGMEQSQTLAKYLERHMSVLKIAEGVHNGGCFTKEDNSSQCFGSNVALYMTDGMRFEIPPGGASLLGSNLKLHESDINIAIGANYHGGYGPQNNTPCGSYGLSNNKNETKNPPCFIIVDVNGDRRPTTYAANVTKIDDNGALRQNYIYPLPTDKKLTDIFPILITDEKAIPFGVVAQRAMYSK